MAKKLKESCNLYQRLVELEQTMEKLGIVIQSHSKLLVLDTRTQTEYYVGRDSDQFPRYVDEPFILIE